MQSGGNMPVVRHVWRVEVGQFIGTRHWACARCPAVCLEPEMCYHHLRELCGGENGG
jgi:hypothetical protein